MANILNQPKIQFLDDNGDPLAGGKVYTYTTGTATPLATYTDSSEDTANANPVILDSAGRADIWLGFGDIYRIVVDDADDNNVIPAIDNLTGEVRSFNAQLTQAADINLNGLSIITNSNKDFSISPHGSGTTDVSNGILTSNLQANGNHLKFESGELFCSKAGNKAILDPDEVSSPVNQVKITNSATGSPAIVEATGDDTNVSMNLLPKGTGTLTVTGTTDYETNVTDDDDIPTVRYISYSLTATAAEVAADTTNTKIIAPDNMKYSPRTCLASIYGFAPVGIGTGNPEQFTSGVVKNGIVSISKISDTEVSLTLEGIEDNGGPSGWNGNLIPILGLSGVLGGTASLQITSIESSDNTVRMRAIDPQTRAIASTGSYYATGAAFIGPYPTS